MTIKMTTEMMLLVERMIRIEQQRPGNKGISDKVALRRAYEMWNRTVS